MIEISKLNKYYKVGKGKMHALKDIDLTIKDGESLAIQGKSGAGKSTLMHIMGLLDSYDSGSLKIDGQEIKGLSDGQLEIILADEPTGALDSETSVEIMNLLKELNEKNGITLIVITHDDSVADYCKRKIIVKDGCIVEQIFRI